MGGIRFEPRIILSAFLFLISSTTLAGYVPNEIQFNEGIDQHGLGIGFSGGAVGGSYYFYDYNLHESNKQIHFQLESASESNENLSQTSKINLNKNSIQLAYRHVYNSGFYFGLIGGTYYTSLELQQTGEMEAQPKQELEFYDRGWLIGPEVGWQGNDFYYFTIGIRNLGRIQTAESYNYWGIYDVANDQKTAADLWDKGRNYSAIYFSFGWYLQAKPARSESEPPSSKADDKLLLEKAKKCQAKGGVWIDDMCRLDVE
jgi:hypothetical protein